MNRQTKIIYTRFAVSLFFIIWGFIWFSCSDTFHGKYIFSTFFVLAGIVTAIYCLSKIIKYRRTGDAETIMDERVEMNRLRASAVGLQFFIFSFAILFSIWGFKLINDTVFVSLAGPVFAAGVMIYIVFYNIYERKG